MTEKQVQYDFFDPDHYSDHHFRDGGSFPREEVERYINLADGMRAIFSKK